MGRVPVWLVASPRSGALWPWAVAGLAVSRWWRRSWFWRRVVWPLRWRLLGPRRQARLRARAARIWRGPLGQLAAGLLAWVFLRLLVGVCGG